MVENFADLKCPACQKNMVKVFVPTAGVNVDICLDGCGGIYFDGREFDAVNEEHEDIDTILEALKGKTFEKVDESLPRTCPVCGSIMHKNYSSIKKEIQVDDCYSCGGKFLDNGELIKIREEYDTDAERTADTMAFVYETVGVALKELDEQVERKKARRSMLKKLFDRMVYGE